LAEYISKRKRFFVIYFDLENSPFQKELSKEQLTLASFMPYNFYLLYSKKAQVLLFLLARQVWGYL
jgi:hypothetical protein